MRVDFGKRSVEVEGGGWVGSVDGRGPFLDEDGGEDDLVS